MTDVQKEGRDPSTLAEDIYHVLADETDHEVSEENVVWAGEVFKDLLRTRLKKRVVKKGEEVLRFSALGKQDRQIWYQANMPEAAEKMPGKQNFKFLYGDAIEVLMLFLAKEAGHTVAETLENPRLHPYDRLLVVDDEDVLAVSADDWRFFHRLSSRRLGRG